MSIPEDLQPNSPLIESSQLICDKVKKLNDLEHLVHTRIGEGAPKLEYKVSWTSWIFASSSFAEKQKSIESIYAYLTRVQALVNALDPNNVSQEQLLQLCKIAEAIEQLQKVSQIAETNILGLNKLAKEFEKGGKIGQLLDKAFSLSDEEFPSLAKSHAQAQEKVTALEEDWEELNQEEIDEALEAAIQDAAKEASLGGILPNMTELLATPSRVFQTFTTIPLSTKEGPTSAGRLFSLLTTANALLKKAPATKHQEDPSTRLAETTLRAPGRQLTNIAFSKGFRKLNELITNISFIHSSLTSETKEELKRKVISTLKENNPGLKRPAFIPLVVGQESIFERQHIVTLFVQDNTLYYYDSKGISSARRTVSGGDSLKPILEEVADELGLQFEENTTCHQMDSHNCGAFILLFYIATVYLKLDPMRLRETYVTNEEMEEFRNALADDMLQQNAVGAYDYDQALTVAEKIFNTP